MVLAVFYILTWKIIQGIFLEAECQVHVNWGQVA